MQKNPLTSLLFLLSISSIPIPVSAWGSLGHRTVAYLSTLYSNNGANNDDITDVRATGASAGTQTAHMLNTLLLGQDISEAALFPDKVAHIPSFAYSRPWHYIDAADSPPWTCGIELERDCPAAAAGAAGVGQELEGCVISALSNHTARVLDPSLSRYLRGQSLRFVLHFIGDVHQPLHTEALARGGNDIAVRFGGGGGYNTNLHSVWDTLIAHKWRRRDDWYDPHRRVESEEEAAYLWALDLFRSDVDLDGNADADCVFTYGDEDNDDDNNNNSSSSSRNATGIVDCVLQWAQEANQLVCDYVLKDGVDALRDADLSQQYYDGAKDIVDIQIRRAGRRLGKWLDKLAERWDHEEDKRPQQQQMQQNLVVQKNY